MKEFIPIAMIGAPHGVRGEVRVKYYGDDIEQFLAYKTFYDQAKTEYCLDSARLSSKGLIVRFKNLSTRTAIECLKGTELYIKQTQLLAENLEEDEFYHKDLLNLKAYGPDNALLGKVSAIFNFGAGELLEIAREEGASCLVPFTKVMVPFLYISEGYIVLSEQALCFFE